MQWFSNWTWALLLSLPLLCHAETSDWQTTVKSKAARLERLYTLIVIHQGVERITLGNLLSLQAGLQRTSGRHYGPWVNSKNWVNHVLTRPFVDEPGGRMLYSTVAGFALSAPPIPVD